MSQNEIVSQFEFDATKNDWAGILDYIKNIFSERKPDFSAVVSVATDFTEYSRVVCSTLQKEFSCVEIVRMPEEFSFEWTNTLAQKLIVIAAESDIRNVPKIVVIDLMQEAGSPQGDRQRNIFFSNLEKEKDALMTPACFYMFMVPFSYLGQKDEAPKKAELTMLECCIRNTYFPDEFPNFVTNMNIIAETTKGPLPPFPSRAEAPDAQHTMG